MNLNFLQTIDKYIEEVVFYIGHFGILGAITMALLEAIFPFLPLVAIAGINVSNYGMMGYVYTYIGSVAGTILTFYIIRWLFNKRFQNSKLFNNHNNLHKFIDWFEKNSFASVLVVFCIPFLPAFLMNYASGLSNMKASRFIWINIISRIVKVAIYAYLGSSFLTFVNKPINALIALLVLLVIYFVAKFIEKKINRGD